MKRIKKLFNNNSKNAVLFGILSDGEKHDFAMLRKSLNFEVDEELRNEFSILRDKGFCVENRDNKVWLVLDKRTSLLEIGLTRNRRVNMAKTIIKHMAEEVKRAIELGIIKPAEAYQQAQLMAQMANEVHLAALKAMYGMENKIEIEA